MRRSGFTFFEILVAAGLGLILMVVVHGFLVTGSRFALAAEAEASGSSGLQAALDHLVREARQARGHRVFRDRSALQAASPQVGGLPGSCLRLVWSTGTAVYWLDAPGGELRFVREEEPATERVLARGIVVFQVRCLEPDHLAVLLQQGRPGEDAEVPGLLQTLSTSVFHRNFDGSEDSCRLPVRVAGGAPGRRPT